ncbi:hypothetical protein DGN21_13655 [Xanthomonas sp. MLO165]|nr:hypothetical protein C1H21_16075 [Xanthomonas arboricola pv. juglandis]QWN01689.1 hypothetical protein DGN21_13655 [Xanthomonas sp. MLO165]
MAASRAPCDSVSAKPATTTATGKARARAAVNHNCVAIGRRCDMAAASWAQGTTNDAVMWGVLVW